MNGVANAVGNGTLSTAALDAALIRTLSVRFRLGMFDPPSSTVYTTYGPERIQTADSVAAATKAAAQGAVLLRNEGGLLPLSISSLKRTGTGSDAAVQVAVVGPHATTHRDLLGDFYGDAFCPGVSNRTCVRGKDSSCCEWHWIVFDFLIWSFALF